MDGIRVKLSVVLFEDGGRIVAYSPAIDVYGYGETVAEAKDSFQTSLDEFFTYTVQKKTLVSEFERLGWTNLVG